MESNKILPQGLEVPDRTKQTKWIKSSILALFAIIFFGLTWQLFNAGFVSDQGLLFWFWSAATASFGITFLGFLAIVNENKILFWLTNSAILLWYVVAMPKDLYVVLAGVIFLLFSLLFEKRIRDDEKSRVDFSLSRIMRYNLSVMVYALLFIIAFNIYLKAREEFESNPKRFYNQIGYYAARGLEYVPSGLGDYDPDQRFDDFVVKQAERQETEITTAPEPVKNQALEEVKKQLMERFKIEVSGNPLLGEVVAGAVSSKVEQASTSYQKFFPAIFAIIAAGLLKSLSFVFVWLTTFVSWLIFRFLLMIKFFKIGKVQVEVNKLQI